MRRRIQFACLVASLVAVLVPDVVVAQVDGYHMTGINFNFANPGARARGIGGAFVALADDATAALANPAGLAYLERQFSLELIHDEERAPVGQKTQVVEVMGVYPISESYTAVTDASRVFAEGESDRINFGSFVFPVPKWNLGFAAYYASLADLGQDYEIGTGLICINENLSPSIPSAGQTCTASTPPLVGTVYFPQAVSMRLETSLIGVGLGWKLSDTFSIGASVSYVETTLDGVASSRALVDEEGNNTGPDLTQTSSVDDGDYMYSLGVLYRGSVWGFGVNYRSETEFEISSISFCDSVVEGFCEIGDPLPRFDEEGQISPEFDGAFRIPERLAAGVAFFPGDRWVIAGEYVHIPYSVMPEGMPSQFDQSREFADVEYAMSDVDEYHIGAEYTTFSGRKGWSVRVGYWRDQSHLTFSSQGYNDPIRTDSEENFYQDLLQADSALLYEEFSLDFDHYTAGFGAAFGTFRLDLAVDYSDDAGTDVLLSGVFYF